MAAIVSKYSVGNQRRLITESFMPQNMAGVTSKGMGAWWQDLISGGLDLAKSRFGTPPGTLVQNPDGSITYRQPVGSTTTLPITPTYGGSSTSIQAPEGFATGMSVGMIALIGVGVVLVLSMGRRK